MKVLIWSQNFLPDLGGLERNSFTLALTLSRAGYEVRVLTTTLTPEVPAFPFPTVRSRRMIDMLRCVAWADLVFTNGGLTLKVCTLALLLGKPFVPVYQTSEVFLREGAGGLAMQLRKWLAGSARMSATVSHHAKVVLEGLLPGHRVVALPNPIDPELGAAAERLRAGEPLPKVHDLLFSGRMIDGKGIFHLVDVVAALRPKLDLSLAFAGDGEHKERLLAHAAAAGIRFIYLGCLDREQLITAYLQARLLVVPSSTHTEGNPLVIAEALSVGTPVLASDQAAMVEAVGQAGLVFRRGDVTDLANQLARIMEAECLSQATTNTAMAAREFSYALYCERLAGIMSTVIA